MHGWMGDWKDELLWEGRMKAVAFVKSCRAPNAYDCVFSYVPKGNANIFATRCAVDIDRMIPLGEKRIFSKQDLRSFDRVVWEYFYDKGNSAIFGF